MGKQFDYELDEKRLEEICVRTYNALFDRRDLFARGVKRFLPQFNLPLDLDDASVKERIFSDDFPWEVEVSNPEEASWYLNTCSFLERMNQSVMIIQNAHMVWNNPEKNWIFNPRRVADESLDNIEAILKGDFQFNLQGISEDSPAKRFQYNAKLLLEKYDGDPRKIVDGKTVEEARKGLMELKGIGTGIANLFIIYMMDRKLASPKDPDCVLLKVDVHKGRIPVNCSAVRPKSREIYRDETYADGLEKEYRAICDRNGFDARVLDAALWVTGSKGCARQDYSHCQMNCPLFDICEGFTPENKLTGRFLVYDSDGNRIDTRRHKGQGLLVFE